MLDPVRYLKFGILSIAASAVASSHEIQQAFAAVPTADRWMYSFNSTPGSRTIASTFSALPAAGGVDDRFGQFLLKFDTVAAGIPAGLGAENYKPVKIILTAVLGPSENVLYDPTEDSRLTYVPSAIADLDSGRPLELHGTGFRGGFTAATFLENSAFGSSAPGGRNAYALGYTPTAVARDTSHNVSSGFDSLPWALGKILVKPPGETVYTELAAGAVIPTYARAEFEINLAIPGVANYIKQSFHAGFIWLTVTSLHSVTQQASQGYPSYFTKENPEQILFGDVAATLSMSWSLPLEIRHFSRDPVSEMVRVDWNASPGYIYQVESGVDLDSSVWTRHGPFSTISPAILSWQSPSPEPRAFFRVTRRSAL